MSKNKIVNTKNRLINTIDPPVIVLLYHRVTDLKKDTQLLAVSPQNFMEHIKVIKGNFPILRFEEDWSKIKEPSVSITFDDGYADNYYKVLPIIDQEKVPATFFISSGYVDKEIDFWWDVLESMVLLNKNFPDSIYFKDINKKWDTVSKIERKIFYEDMMQKSGGFNIQQTKQYLQKLADLSGSVAQPRSTSATLKKDELLKLASHPMVTIGAHTVSHVMLSALKEYDQKMEIHKSKEYLEEILNIPIKVFSYPFGEKKSYTKETVNIVRKAGFIKAASNYPGQFHSWRNPFEIPRQIVRNWHIDEFKNRLHSFWVNGK